MLLGLQELPQFRQQYGKDTAETICSVAANVLSGSARHKDTLMWLEKLFGKVRQLRNGISVDRHRTSISMNEYMDYLIPASTIANLKTGELVGHVAAEHAQSANTRGMNTYHCNVRIDSKKLGREEKQYGDTPVYYDFGGKQETILEANMKKIADEVKGIVEGA